MYDLSPDSASSRPKHSPASATSNRAIARACERTSTSRSMGECPLSRSAASYRAFAAARSESSCAWSRATYRRSDCSSFSWSRCSCAPCRSCRVVRVSSNAMKLPPISRPDAAVTCTDSAGRMILGYTRGLAASPRVGYILKREGHSSGNHRVLRPISFPDRTPSASSSSTRSPSRRSRPRPRPTRRSGRSPVPVAAPR